MLNKIIFIVLIIVLSYYYLKKIYNIENFEVLFSKYYPINNDNIIKYNNYNNEIQYNKLDILKETIKNIKKEINGDNNTYYIFNYSNQPVIKKTIEDEKIKSLNEFLIDTINKKLPKGHQIKLEELEDIYKLEVENEVKINFKIVCDYNIENNKTYHFKQNNETEKIIIDVEIISIKNIDDNQLHLNIFNLIGFKSIYLDGSNNEDYDNNFLFDKKLSNTIINHNNEESNNDLNETINTDEIESFFNL